MRVGRINAAMDALLPARLERQQSEHLRRELIEGCKAMTDVHLTIEQEYHPREEEVARLISRQSPVQE